MTGASIEATLELWASSLRDVKARIRHLFTQRRVTVSAEQFLDGLLGDEPRKTGWIAEPKLRAIPVRGVSRRSLGEGVGMPMICAT